MLTLIGKDWMRARMRLVGDGWTTRTTLCGERSARVGAKYLRYAVLLQGAQMPVETDLPKTSATRYRNAFELSTRAGRRTARAGQALGLLKHERTDAKPSRCVRRTTAVRAARQRRSGPRVTEAGSGYLQFVCRAGRGHRRFSLLQHVEEERVTLLLARLKPISASCRLKPTGVSCRPKPSSRRPRRRRLAPPARKLNVSVNA